MYCSGAFSPCFAGPKSRCWINLWKVFSEVAFHENPVKDAWPECVDVINLLVNWTLSREKLWPFFVAVVMLHVSLCVFCYACFVMRAQAWANVSLTERIPLINYNKYVLIYCCLGLSVLVIIWKANFDILKISVPRLAGVKQKKSHFLKEWISDFFCFVHPSLDTKLEFKYIEIALLRPYREERINLTITVISLAIVKDCYSTI